MEPILEFNTIFDDEEYIINIQTKPDLLIITLFDIMVMSTELNGKQGQKVLDLRGLADGFYVYSVRCGDRITTGKLIITK